MPAKVRALAGHAPASSRSGNRLRDLNERGAARSRLQFDRAAAAFSHRGSPSSSAAEAQAILRAYCPSTSPVLS